MKTQQMLALLALLTGCGVSATEMAPCAHHADCDEDLLCDGEHRRCMPLTALGPHTVVATFEGFLDQPTEQPAGFLSMSRPNGDVHMQASVFAFDNDGITIVVGTVDGAVEVKLRPDVSAGVYDLSELAHHAVHDGAGPDVEFGEGVLRIDTLDESRIAGVLMATIELSEVER